MAAVNMTEGNITKHLVRYSVPLILGNLFQLTYNAVDSIIAGRFIGKQAPRASGQFPQRSQSSSRLSRLSWGIPASVPR